MTIQSTNPESQTALRKLGVVVMSAGMAALAACAPPPPVVVPPPPAPVQYVPAKPVPPAGAASTMRIPMMASSGVRQTVNANISPAQTTWNLRAALNVAALNCRDARYSSLISGYESYLNKHSRELSRTNTAVGREFRAEHGRSYRNAQDSYMTQVYNYYASPPTLDNFCNAAVPVVAEAALVDRGGLEAYSAGGLAQLEAVFERFFSAYDQYRRDLSAWNTRYGPNAVPGTPVRSGFQSSQPAPATSAPLPTEGPLLRSEPVDQTVAADPASQSAAPAQTSTPAAQSSDTAPAPAPGGGPVFRSSPVVQDVSPGG